MRGRRASPRALIDVWRRLTPRDYTIGDLLHQHGVLTTTQLTSVLFGSPITCRHRMQALASIRFVAGFGRNRPGWPHPMCWVAGDLASRAATLAAGEPVPTPRAVLARQDQLMGSPMLDHLLGVNSFFTSLLATARRRNDAQLLRWWPEPEAAQRFGKHIHPDGHGVWQDGNIVCGFFLEYDRGTEPHHRLLSKLDSYLRLHALGGPGFPVLFVFTSAVREANLHRILAQHGYTGTVPVATASLTAGQDPAGAVWRPAGTSRRVRLALLPCDPGSEGPFNPGTAETRPPLWRLLPPA
jgi:hypothetical protein